MSSGDPLNDVPLFREIQRVLLSSPGPVNWELARQVAIATASWGTDDPQPAEGDTLGLVETVRLAELAVADLTLDPSTREVRRGGRRITLTVREHALLEYFMRSAGRVLTRPMLAEHVWGLDFDPESNIVDVYVGYLRRKIDGAGEARPLHTVRGAGYVLRADAP